jgi:hypothetical protein
MATAMLVASSIQDAVSEAVDSSTMTIVIAF